MIRDLRYLLKLLVFSLLLIGCSENETDIPPPGDDQFVDIYEPDLSFKVVGYFPYYRFSLLDDIDMDQLDYLIIAFTNPQTNGSFQVGNGVSISNVVQRAKQAGCKVLISIGGGGLSASQDAIWKNRLNDSNRESTIISLVEFTEQHGLDGIDVDLEGNLLSDLGNGYNLFVRDLRKHLHAKGKAITGAVYPLSVRSNISRTTLQAFDFLNIMIYNAKGLWNLNDPGPHASYEFAEQSLDFWELSQGIPSYKLVFGMPFYGIDFDPSVAKAVTYASIVDVETTYAYHNNVGLLFYDGIPDVVAKTQLALERANGVMVWELGQDSFTGLSLMKAIYEVIDAWPCNNGPVMTWFPDDDGDGYGNHLYPVQACEAPQGYVSNNIDSDDSDPNVI
jgi:GH18 family chitinase